MASILESYQKKLKDYDQEIRDLKSKIFEKEDQIESLDKPQSSNQNNPSGFLAPDGMFGSDMPIPTRRKSHVIAESPQDSYEDKLDKDEDAMMASLPKLNNKPPVFGGVSSSRRHSVISQTPFIPEKEADKPATVNGTNNPIQNVPIVKQRRQSVVSMSTTRSEDNYSEENNDKNVSNQSQNRKSVFENTKNNPLGLLNQIKLDPKKDPREALKEYLHKKWSAQLNTAMEEQMAEVSELREFKTYLIKQWESRFTSAHSMFEDSHLKKVMRRQAKILNMASEIAAERNRKKPKEDKGIACHISGMNLNQLKQHDEFKIKHLKELVLRELKEKFQHQHVTYLSTSAHSSNERHSTNVFYKTW